ncbi:hypothetical protein SAMN05660350_00433 [Geodermatophilus obscurus]|uniref:Uncharacterized protein n=1 Tax=Geodermatophilus obscurus TaxID=1861 RepID=A0A1M7S2K6_9ACTN|nr:hypothetical protein [Geodermatophilus obscurus]SHN52847.1 hypothetical protein SAMN05660350_00433 [Geodermatophilus obscurus]
MSAIQQRHLLEVLQRQIDKVPEVERVANYSQQLKDHLSTVLAMERDHRTKGGNIVVNVTGQVELLARSLADGPWTPGGGE